MLAHGVPLLLAGDEVGNSQDGNNNAYCQDNRDRLGRLAGLAQPDDDMTDLVGRLADLRRRFPQLRPRHWTEGRREDGSFGVLWLTPQATEMTEEDWNFPDGRFLAYVLGPVEGSPATLFVVLNAATEAITLTLPRLPGATRWTILLETAQQPRTGQESPADSTLEAAPRTILVFEGAE